MEGDKTDQLSDLLACRSSADLRRLREVDSPSFPFITLACKHNRADLLKFLLEDDTSSLSVGAVDIDHHWCSLEQEDEGHDAAYYAIRSSNVELLRTLLSKVTPELSERLVSKSYEELLLNNVLLSEEMNLYVQYTLLELRFFPKGDEVLPVTSSANIQERIQMLVENVAQIKTYVEVDSHFVYTAKFISQNIHILKQQLKSTYNILPWEEMEFCLVSFVSARIRRQELNIFYLSILKKERLLKELDKFTSALQDLKEHIGSTDVQKLRCPVKIGREDVTAAISIRYPDLYADYNEVRDISSLHIMKTYLEAAMVVDSATRLGQLTIKRALQMTGEHLKSTLDSPKLSPAVSDLLLLTAPKETRKVLQELRNSISHPHLELKESILYSKIQNDIKTIASTITTITYSKKVDKIKCLLTTLINSDNADEFHEIVNVFRSVSIVDDPKKNTVIEDQNIENLLKDLFRYTSDQTPNEIKLFDEIKYVLEKTKFQRHLARVDYSVLKSMVRISTAINGFRDLSQKIVENLINTGKFIAKKALENFPSEKNPLDSQKFSSINSLTTKFYNSVSTRVKPEIADKINIVLLSILVAATTDNSDIKFIDDYNRQILVNKINTNKNVGEKYNSGETIDKQLTLTITDLGNTLGRDRICGQFYEHLCSLYKDEAINRFPIETLVLETMTLLYSSKRVPNNVLYLDGDMPQLSGKCLRNHLAHGNALVDILPTGAWSAVLLNALKLTKSEHLLRNCKVGNIYKHDIKQLKQRYERGLSILNKQKEMWKSLLDGNFENLAIGIAKGADIYSRKEDLSSTLHCAARGSNVEIIKFLTTQKMISTELRDVDGRTALHVAATYGRDITVKFLVVEMRNAINQVDGDGNTPLHLASQNGHKKTVETLLSLGAKTTVKNITGNPPLHSAVIYNNLDVVKIFLEKEAFENEYIYTGGFTSLHVAAENGHIEMVRYLLLNEADVNARSDQGVCPLHLAALNGHLKVVNTLLENGAHLNLRDCDGCSALYFAVEHNHEEIVKTLLEKGSFVNNRVWKENSSTFHWAVSKGNIFIVSLLLKHNANVNDRTDKGLTPLLIAAQCGYSNIVDLLLQNGALTKSRDISGSTALHYAALFGHTSIVEALIRSDVGIHTKTIQQSTPLHLAAYAGHQQVVSILLAAGSDLHSFNEMGSTALHISAVEGHEAISEALIKKGASLNCKNNSNKTPLHEAASQTSNEKNIKILLKYGADVNEKWEFGHTALHFASEIGDSQMVEALLQEKADVDAQTDGGATALHLAVGMNQKAAVEILLKYGADVNHLDITGFSALCCAVKNNNKDLLDILIANGADVNVGGGQPLFSAISAGHRLVIEALLKNKKIDLSIKYPDGSNFLYAAAVSGDALIARELIKKGIKIADCTSDHSPLYHAISYGHTEFVDVLLENGANINPTDSNFSPLFTAVSFNKPDIMEKLIQWGANSDIRDLRNKTPLELAVAEAQIQNTLILLQQASISINERGNKNNTILHIAAKAGNLEITNLLVDRGADINAINIYGSKPIHIAAMKGHHNILGFFLELGMSIDDRKSTGYTLMHCAAAGGHLAMAQYLVDKRVDINSTDLEGTMPIHCSARQGHTDMVKFLLENGAMYDSTDIYGKTPSDLTNSQDVKEVIKTIGKLFKAVKINDVPMVDFLIKKMVKYVNVKSSDNATLLHIASWKGFQEICNILLKSEANPNAVGKGGNGPLHYASKYSHPGIVEYLLKNGAVHDLEADNMKTPLDFAEQKDIKYLLQMIAHCFRKVRFGDVKVIEDIAKLRDVEITKAVMKARDIEGNSLVVVAIKNGFPVIDELKQVSQCNVPQILSKVKYLLVRERFTEALDILKQLLTERIEILGEDNPGTLDIQYEIAQALCGQCKYGDALSIFEYIFKKRVEVFGPHHPVSLATRSRVAFLLYRLGRIEESWNTFEEVMSRQQEVLDEGHEQLLETKFNAAAALISLGKHEEALQLQTQVYKIRENTFGAHHRVTVTLQNNIANVLRAQGKQHEAFALLQRVYEMRKIMFGLNHSLTLVVKCHMGIILMEQEKLEEALQVFQEILPIQKNVLGQNHENTLKTQGLIKSIFLRQNNFLGALKVHKAGLNARNSIFGPNHLYFTEEDRYMEDIEKTASNYHIAASYSPPCDFKLLKAVSEGDRGEICSLIENGSDVNTADAEGRTALHFATTVKITELLLNSGADPTATSQKGNTPLHLATSRACRQTVRLLLQNVKTSKPKAYRKFINAKTVVGGSTALHVATKKGLIDIVSCLLTHGACYNSRDRSYNRTPLQYSCSPSVTRLLHLAEEVFEMAMRGGTVLPQADERHLAVVMNSRDTENRTPLQVALVHDHKTTASLLAGLLKAHDYRPSVDALD